MARKRTRIVSKRRLHQKRRRKVIFRRLLLLAVLFFALSGTGFYLKEKIAFYYAYYFNRFEHKKLKNTAFEAERIDKITGMYADQIFGFDISHYQNPQDLQWDSLSIGNRSIPLRFVILQATMVNISKILNLDEFLTTTQKLELIRGAYQFYRLVEDPVVQANNFLETVKLEGGDLVPVLDIEKRPVKYSRKKLIENLKIWIKIVEEKYGKKPIIYTYYHYYRDELRGEFDGYPLWLANYNDVPQPSPEDPWMMWQFTESGIVYGINTKVDLNIFNGNMRDLEKLMVE